MTRTAVVTPEFRISFCNLFKPKEDMNGRLKYDIEMLFKKPVTAISMTELREMYDGAIKPAWIQGNENYRKFNQCFIDGDLKKQESRKNHLLLRAWCSPENPPTLFTQKMTHATEKEIYPGCYARAILTVFAYEAQNNGKGPIVNRGVAFNLNTVQKTRDGVPLSSMLQDHEALDLLTSRPLPVDMTNDHEIDL